MHIKLKKNNRDSLKYHLWLGGDLGFTSEITGYKGTGPLRSIDFEDPKATAKKAAVDSSDGKLFENPSGSDTLEFLDGNQKHWEFVRRPILS